MPGSNLFRRATFKAANALRTANYWLIAQVAIGLLRLLRRLPADRALDFIDRAARRLGPLFGRHRVALDNLRRAFPEKSEDEIKQIALDMWGNMARLGVEYIFMEQLFDFVPDSDEPARVEVIGEELFRQLRDEKRPHIFFTGHIGNFELLPVAAAAYELPVAALFRAPNNPYLAAEVLSKREDSMGDLIASRRGAAFTLARVLERGGNVGMLVDQKFRRGVETTFFGRPCETSPLLAKLARQYECDVYPALSVRLPGNRFRLTIFDKLDLPRTSAGTLDIDATTRLLNDIVEEWVRANPGQWMWFHKRWKLSR
ncbi:lipid A biosynthesis lauroyl acyltransferase [Mesorhizobium xinjiangense]|uniref:lipid A biosynthesis lauroyl acyltransferase n=1 Tax=Mesorhizobium xinjiangense TaxID=2678685 RepID=UPI0012EDBB00|nr:lipid A biosynthesis lauroyl acyltransferase [Mesorhizobium xinjiangense]